MNYTTEAVGIARAACQAAMAIAIAFTVETDGRLPTGQSLADAVRQVDDATGGWPSYYMINCAHPSHFAGVLDAQAAWTGRIRGLRANASTRSHAELNESADLDIGDPAALAEAYAALRRGALPRLNILGGCCGTDHRHIERIAAACVPLVRSTAEAASCAA
jgi:homocysteine S-methyltransferase